jgi:hypothetical protein
MKRLVILVCLLFGGIANAANPAVTKFECNSKDQIGNEGKLDIDLVAKTIILSTSNGKETAIFNAQTLCGWQPSAGTAGVTCSFSTNQPDASLSNSVTDLSCTDADAAPLIHGSLDIESGSGQLMCGVLTSNIDIELDLSACHSL